MSRSIKKGPFVAPELIKRVEEMNKTKETIFPEVIYFDEKYVDSEIEVAMQYNDSCSDTILALSLIHI